MGRTWEHVHAFDPTTHYTFHPRKVPTFGLLSRVLAHTFYNPQEHLEFDWLQQPEDYRKGLVTLIEEGLRHDDDLIQQWFGADDVLTLLRAAKTWDEMLMAVEAICGAHESESSVRNYVETVLGKSDP